MKTLKSEEAITILEDMKVNISIPKAAVTQIKRNAALNMAIDALLKCSEMPNDSDTISRQAAIDACTKVKVGAFPHDAGVNNSIKVLKALPSAQPIVLTCDGCRHVGTYDTDFPCSGCIRREKDYYEQER